MSGQAIHKSWLFKTFRPLREKWWRWYAKRAAKGQAMIHARGEQPEGEALLTEMEWFVLMEAASGKARLFSTRTPERTKAFLRLVELNMVEGPVPLSLDVYENQIVGGPGSYEPGDAIMVDEDNKELVAAAQRLANCGLIAQVVRHTETVH